MKSINFLSVVVGAAVGAVGATHTSSSAAPAGTVPSSTIAVNRTASRTSSSLFPLDTLANGSVIQNSSTLRPDLSDSSVVHGTHSNPAPALTLIDCGNRPSFLTEDDCNYMSNIGISGVGFGTSSTSLDNNGALSFNMVNSANVPIIVLVWENFFLSANAPALSISLAAGASQRVYTNGISGLGGFGAIYNHQNTLSSYGNLWNTIGEFSTGDYHTFDVLRNPDMGGSWMQISGDNGCNSEWADNFSQCCFTCSTIETPADNSCTSRDSYWLDNCYADSNPGAGADTDLKSGGCQGWTSASVYFL